jgi:Gly-Xaa carboxypeptidase
VPSNLRRIIENSVHSDKALESLQSFVLENEDFNSLVTTTQAIDLIGGGVKSNALPELAWAVVNHRISVLRFDHCSQKTLRIVHDCQAVIFFSSSVSEVQAHDTALLKHLAKTFNLTYIAFGVQISEEGASASGTLTLSKAFHNGRDPAPITPTDAAPYQLLSGTIKATYSTHRSINHADPVIVAPSILAGNTDTRFYWKLSPHIFRYNHRNAVGSNSSGIHTVNECTLTLCVKSTF